MDGIFANYDRDSKTWSFDVNLELGIVRIYIASFGNDPHLRGSKFFCTATQDEQVLLDYVYPPEGQMLVDSDQSYLGYSAFDVDVDADVRLDFSYENGKEIVSESITFKPIVPAPFDSEEAIAEAQEWFSGS